MHVTADYDPKKDQTKIRVGGPGGDTTRAGLALVTVSTARARSSSSTDAVRYPVRVGCGHGPFRLRVRGPLRYPRRFADVPRTPDFPLALLSSPRSDIP